MILDKDIWQNFFEDTPLTLEYMELCSKPFTDGKGERHHIIPRSICPSLIKESWNLVHLSYQDHYRAHEILPRICLNTTHTFKMLHAWHFMCNRPGISVSSSEEFARLRDNFSSKLSESRKGMKFSDATKLKMSHSNKKPKSKKGYKHTEEARLKMSIRRKDRVFSEETRRKISQSKTGMVKSAEHRVNSSKALKGKPWSEKRREAQNKKDKINGKSINNKP